jgi:hypothetical protein
VRIDEQAELILAETARRLLPVRDGECLFCYVARMLDEHGCDSTLRFARHYRDQRVPRATAVERRMGSMGGFCDCEILLNGMMLGPLADDVRRRVRGLGRARGIHPNAKGFDADRRRAAASGNAAPDGWVIGRGPQ